jgi:hypothetical protein
MRLLNCLNVQNRSHMLSRKQGLFAACPWVDQTIARFDNDIGFRADGFHFRNGVLRAWVWSLQRTLERQCPSTHLELEVCPKPKPHAIQKQGLFAACPWVDQTIARFDKHINLGPCGFGFRNKVLRAQDSRSWRTPERRCPSPHLELLVCPKPKPHAIQKIGAICRMPQASPNHCTVRQAYRFLSMWLPFQEWRTPGRGLEFGLDSGTPMSMVALNCL